MYTKALSSALLLGIAAVASAAPAPDHLPPVSALDATRSQLASDPLAGVASVVSGIGSIISSTAPSAIPSAETGVGTIPPAPTNTAGTKTGSKVPSATDIGATVATPTDTGIGTTVAHPTDIGISVPVATATDIGITIGTPTTFQSATTKAATKSTPSGIAVPGVSILPGGQGGAKADNPDPKPQDPKQQDPKPQDPKPQSGCGGSRKRSDAQEDGCSTPGGLFDFSGGGGNCFLWFCW